MDTGILLAAADADDRWHDQARAVLDRPPTDLVIPVPVAVEAAWLIATRLGAATEAAFVASVAAGEFTLANLNEADWARCADLVARYADLDLGLVDASVVAITERLASPLCQHRPPGSARRASHPVAGLQPDSLALRWLAVSRRKSDDPRLRRPAGRRGFGRRSTKRRFEAVGHGLAGFREQVAVAVGRQPDAGVSEVVLASSVCRPSAMRKVAQVCRRLWSASPSGRPPAP